jgi:lipoprotein-releasing system ATP-binding protein
MSIQSDSHYPLPAGARVLAARGIEKSFQLGDRSIQVLHGAHIDVHRGERVCLMGASGAGKSTFLHILGLLEHPSSGSVELAGQDAWGLSITERARLRNRHIGFVFQFYHLLPELDAVENVLLPAMIADAHGDRRFEKRADRERAREFLVKFGLAERLRHKPAQLSGGERQRVAVARALFLDPSILIADEPTGNLDTATGSRVLELLFAEQAERDLALLLVTHDERLAARCERVLQMQDGRILGEPCPVL